MAIKIPEVYIKEMVALAAIAIRKTIEQGNGRVVSSEEGCEIAIREGVRHLELRLSESRTRQQQEAMPMKDDGSGFAKIGSIDERGPTALGGPPEVLKKEAIARGFVGEACPHCMNFRMRRTGTCLTCQDCGFNKGCD